MKLAIGMHIEHILYAFHLSLLSMRLVGLAALVGVVNSEALYHSLTHFQPQVNVIMRALVLPFYQVDVSELDHE